MMSASEQATKKYCSLMVRGPAVRNSNYKFDRTSGVITNISFGEGGSPRSDLRAKARCVPLERPQLLEMHNELLERGLVAR
jgi:hypothetical protein